MKKVELTAAGKEFAKKVQAYALRKLDVTKPYKATPAVKPAAPKAPTSQTRLRLKGETVNPGKSLSKETRNALRKDYLFGTETNEALAEKYDIHPNTIYNVAERENWRELKELYAFDAHVQELGERIVEAVREQLSTPGAITICLDNPGPPPETDEEDDEENEEVAYETEAEEPAEENESETNGDDGPLKWSF